MFACTARGEGRVRVKVSSLFAIWTLHTASGEGEDEI